MVWLVSEHGVVRRRLRERSVRHRAAVCLIASLGAIAFAVLATSSYSADARSGFVQRHGTRATAIVASVHNHLNCNPRGGSACFPRAELSVRLIQPIAGVRRAAIAYPGYSRLKRGARVAVLDDPRDPRYAELPRARSRGAGGWIALVAFAVVFGVLALAEAQALARILLRRRRA